MSYLFDVQFYFWIPILLGFHICTQKCCLDWPTLEFNHKKTPNLRVFSTFFYRRQKWQNCQWCFTLLPFLTTTMAILLELSSNITVYIYIRTVSSWCLSKRYEVKECAMHGVYWVNLKFKDHNSIDASLNTFLCIAICISADGCILSQA